MRRVEAVHDCGACHFPVFVEWCLSRFFPTYPELPHPYPEFLAVYPGFDDIYPCFHTIYPGFCSTGRRAGAKPSYSSDPCPTPIVLRKRYNDLVPYS
ncbi:hypothetical protein JNUCC1_01606 [Lentibacillus sp. JNUCC-1]|nr:hypothetical protein [Lentibacillus sp. JNUCC-1]